MLVQFLDHLVQGGGLTLLAEVDSLLIYSDLLAHLNVLELELLLSGLQQVDSDRIAFHGLLVGKRLLLALAEQYLLAHVRSHSGSACEVHFALLALWYNL